jgi:hypothetical protein
MYNVLYYLLGIIVLIIFLKIYTQSEIFNLKCIISNVDGNRYCVRDRKNKQRSADLLAKVNERCQEIVNYLKEKHPQDERIKRLNTGFNPKNINETLPTSKLTAYSENKGEKVAFCLNKKSKTDETPDDELIDLETLTFVAFHELTHIMCKTYGHNDEFWQNFKFMLENAETSGIYKSSDYKKNPKEYCGMTINDNPYYDLI